MDESPKRGRGSNSAQLRRYNERIVLQILRRAGEASKAELARAVQLTNAAIGAIIQNLVEDGLIQEAGKRHDGSRGQPATILKLAPRGAFSFGVRIDRTRLETLLVDFSGNVLGRKTHQTILPSPEDTLRVLCEDLGALREELSDEECENITGIGLAQPFNLGAWLHELGLPEANFRKWDDFDLAAALRRETELPVFSQNDGTAAAIAELFYGHGRRHDDFLYLFLGPAIGGGLIVGGDTLQGASGNAGDVAMVPVPLSQLATAPKPRHQWDLLLTRASLVSLARHMSPGDFASLTREDLQSALDIGTQAALEWQADCVSAIAFAVRSAYALLEMPLLIIDSDLGGAFGPQFISDLADALLETAPEQRQSPEILFGSFGPAAGALGAASLPHFANYSPRASILTGGRVNGPAGASSKETHPRTSLPAARFAANLASPDR